MGPHRNNLALSNLFMLELQAQMMFECYVQVLGEAPLVHTEQRKERF